MDTTGRSIVLTGISRGLGAALFDRFVERGDRVLGVGRRFTAAQRRTAAERPDAVQLLDADLADTGKLPSSGTLARFFRPADREVVLVHNAAVVTPLGMVGGGSAFAAPAAGAVAVNLTAVIVLTDAFLAARPPSAAATVVYVSSRAAEVPKAGQAVYCATKSAGEMFCAALAQEGGDVRVVTVRTPAMDTGMQESIRATADLPDRDEFVRRYADHQLADPRAVARDLIDRHVPG